MFTFYNNNNLLHVTCVTIYWLSQPINLYSKFNPTAYCIHLQEYRLFVLKEVLLVIKICVVNEFEA